MEGVRRSEERPDSPFGEKLKEHLRRVRDFTQADLAQESLIAEKTLSNMVKGKRISGTALRRDLRAIIEVLYKKNLLHSLEEANLLITKIPAIKELDERDPDDAKIIALFDTTEIETAQTVSQDNDNEAEVKAHASGVSRDDVSPSDTMPETTITQSKVLPSAIPETTARMGRKTRKRLWWSTGSILVAVVIILGIVLTIHTIFSRQCSDSTNGITLYTDINYQGHCRTFGPGNYELALYGLEQNVSSIKNPHDAYHITLYDKEKNFSYVDKDTPVLTAEWDNRADTMLVEKIVRLPVIQAQMALLLLLIPTTQEVVSSLRPTLLTWHRSTLIRTLCQFSLSEVIKTPGKL